MNVWYGVFIAPLATVVAVIVGNLLSSRQSGKSKIWDLQREAYGAILSGLGSIDRFLEACDIESLQETSNYHSGLVYQKYGEPISEYMTAVQQRFSDDYLILSPDFVCLFDSLLRAIAQGDYQDSGTHHEIFAKAVREYRPLLLKVARDEIVGSRFHGWRPGRRPRPSASAPSRRLSR